MSNEWSARGINVNAIAPGYVKTDLTQDLIKDPEKNKYALMRTPIGRWGDPNDLAGAVVWLASAAGDWVTGGVFPVDGGYTAW
jgi:NAD(P)-dependent dehydrogenase (short-subunit alcohol dehydrogenase family)